MARLNITSLNYMNVGGKRAFFNFDEENKEKTCVSEFGPRSSQLKNLFSVTPTNSSTVDYYPMYDIVDMSIKSQTNLGYKNKNINAEDTYQNIFAPKMESQPVGFVQYDVGALVDTFMLTKDTENDPYIFYSDNREQRATNNQQSFHKWSIKQDKTNTILYENPEGKQIETTDQAISAFEIDRNVRGIKKNFILEFQDSAIDSEYDTGNIHADIYTAKNHLNAEYDMEMPSENQLVNTRRYCGIDRSANRVYLKYYDSVNYTINDGGTDRTTQRSEDSNLPYQKIEMVSNNVFSNKCKHKSNLFSIKISDLEELSDNETQSTIVQDQTERHSLEMAQRIKDDLFSAINDITKNVCPVNTQLFKVYFGN